MSELSFLIELLLNPKLPRALKELVAARVKEVESKLIEAPLKKPIALPQQALPPQLQNQAPSTLALMAKHGDISNLSMPEAQPIPEPVTQLAHTPAAAAAIQSRNAAINDSINGRIDKVSGRPKKW